MLQLASHELHELNELAMCFVNFITNIGLERILLGCVLFVPGTARFLSREALRNIQRVLRMASYSIYATVFG